MNIVKTLLATAAMAVGLTGAVEAKDKIKWRACLRVQTPSV